MTDPFNDPLHILLCDSLCLKPPPDCTTESEFDSEPDLEQEQQIEPEPEPESELKQPEPGLGHSVDHSPPTSPEIQPHSVYHAWLASRVPTRQNGGYITAGAQRPLTRANLRLAHRIAELCVPQMLHIFWSRHPFRAFVMVAFSFVRGIFPVFKGYTHALIINEASLHVSSRLLRSHRFFPDPEFALFRSLHMVPFDSPRGRRVFASCC